MEDRTPRAEAATIIARAFGADVPNVAREVIERADACEFDTGVESDIVIAYVALALTREQVARFRADLARYAEGN